MYISIYTPIHIYFLYTFISTELSSTRAVFELRIGGIPVWRFSFYNSRKKLTCQNKLLKKEIYIYIYVYNVRKEIKKKNK